VLLRRELGFRKIGPLQSRSIELGTQRREAGTTAFEQTKEEGLPGWGEENEKKIELELPMSV